jgi:hypothetical protein
LPYKRNRSIRKNRHDYGAPVMNHDFAFVLYAILANVIKADVEDFSFVDLFARGAFRHLSGMLIA